MSAIARPARSAGCRWPSWEPCLDGPAPGTALWALARNQRRDAASSVAPVRFTYERSLRPCLACCSRPRAAPTAPGADLNGAPPPLLDRTVRPDDRTPDGRARDDIPQPRREG